MNFGLRFGLTLFTALSGLGIEHILQVGRLGRLLASELVRGLFSQRARPAGQPRNISAHDDQNRWWGCGRGVRGQRGHGRWCGRRDRLAGLGIRLGGVAFRQLKVLLRVGQ